MCLSLYIYIYICWAPSRHVQACWWAALGPHGRMLSTYRLTRFWNLKKEQAIDKTKQELDQNDQEMTLCGEGAPNLDGDTLEDLSMQLQLSVLERMRELGDLNEARRTYQMSLFKLCYDAKAFPNIPDAMPLKRIFWRIRATVSREECWLRGRGQQCRISP